MGLEYSDENEFDINKIDNPIWLLRQTNYTKKIKNMVCCGTYFFYWPQKIKHRIEVHGDKNTGCRGQ